MYHFVHPGTCNRTKLRCSCPLCITLTPQAEQLARSVYLICLISEPVTLSEDMELKPELVIMSPPASDSGSGSPSQLSPFCLDSEPGSPLLDHEQVST